MQVSKVTGMTCGHCERAVIQPSQALDPATRVPVGLAEGRVRVDSALDEQAEGYRVE